MAAVVLLIAVLGAAVGSFLNVVIHRVPLGESVIRPRSRCPQCATEIGARDNIPVVSWVVLGGRCRTCGTAISGRYPLVELLTALLFVSVALIRGFHDDLLLQLPFVALLIACAAIDIEHRILPNKLLLPGAVWAAVAAALVMRPELPELAIAGAAGFGALLLIALIQPRGMGMGDVKLTGMMGLYLGSSLIPALLVAFLAGSVAGAAVMVREGSGARKKAVPFGPFLALGGIAGLLAGPELIDAYRSAFLG